MAGKAQFLKKLISWSATTLVRLVISRHLLLGTIFSKHRHPLFPDHARKVPRIAAYMALPT
jgi:hypothetical protein